MTTLVHKLLERFFPLNKPYAISIYYSCCFLLHKFDYRLGRQQSFMKFSKIGKLISFLDRV